MKKTHELFVHKSVFMRYLSSYCGLVLLLCAIFGISLFTLTVRELNDLSNSEVDKRAQSVVEDLDKQIEIMQDIAYKLSNDFYIRPAYLKQNKYHEIELLDALKKYSGYSPIVSDYFLFYDGDSMAYTPAGKTKCSVSILFETTLGFQNKSDAESAYERMMALESYEILMLPNGNMLFAYPMRLQNSPTFGAVISFLVKRDQLIKRVGQIGGDFYGIISLEKDELILLGEKQTGSPIYSKNSEKGFSLKIYGLSLYSRLDQYQHTFFMLILGLLVIFVLLGIYMAVRNYRPLKELVLQFGEKPGYSENEFQMLNKLVKRSLEDSRLSRQKLADNMKWLNHQRMCNLEQMLLLALTGNLPAEINLLNGYEILDEGRSFIVICVKTEKDLLPKDMHDQIAALGDATTSFCAVRLPYESVIAVVISFAEDLDHANVSALITSLFDAWSIPVSISLGSVCEDFDNLSESFFTALTGLDKNDEGNILGDEGLKNAVLAAIKNGDEQTAIQMLTELLEWTNAANTTLIYRSCAMADIVNAILRVSVSAGVNVSVETLGIVLQYAKPDVVMEKIVKLTVDVCRKIGNKRDRQDEFVQKRLLSYIRDHITDYDLSLPLVAKENGMNTKRLEYLIKSETGCTFKEYVITERMEKAKEMLKDGVSVAETGNAVCYNSISYFIRTFKQHTGMTPTEYRRTLEKND